MEQPHCSLSLSSLLCSEKGTCFDEQEEMGIDSISSPVSETEEEEYVLMLLDRETTSESMRDCAFMTQDWLKCARLNAIEWILKTREAFGFRFLTAYLSVTYLDRFLSKRSVDSEKPWAIQLLSVACLSLAAKMEECDVPALSEFVSEEEYNFESKVIQRMELLVLNTLEWRLTSVIPFPYLHYFSTKLSDDDESAIMGLVSRGVDLIMSTIKEMSLMHHRPSAIAMAAVLAALNKGFTRKMVEVKMSLVSSCPSLEQEQVLSCYNLMVELEMAKIKTPQLLLSPDFSSIYSTSPGVNEDSSISWSSTTKRRRLTFQDYDKSFDKRLP